MAILTKGCAQYCLDGYSTINGPVQVKFSFNWLKFYLNKKIFLRLHFHAVQQTYVIVIQIAFFLIIQINQFFCIKAN